MKKRGEIIKYVLETLFLTGAIAIAMTSPYFLHKVVKAYFRNRKYINKKIVRYLRYLINRKLISLKKEKGLIKIGLTERGRRKLESIQIEELKLKKSRKWDGQWRIIIFDIPKDRLREKFRLKLREFGFYKFQQSVWIYPFKCEEEIVLLRKLLRIDPYIKIIVTQELEADEKILKFFKLAKKSLK